MTRTRAYWTCQLGGWMAYILLNGLFIAFEGEYSWWNGVYLALFFVLGLGITHGYRAYVRKRQWLDLSLRQLGPRVLLASVLSASILVGLFCLLTWPLRPFLPNEARDFSLQYALLWDVNLSILMFVWSVLYFGLHYFWSYRQAEVEKWKLQAQVETTKLRALELQLNPHFFFNSLNSVRALIVEDPERAQTMVTRLAGLLRYTLQSNPEMVPLRDELRTARSYLELESVRLEDRLRYSFDVDETLLDVPVPFLLVQTLVENGIKHGIAVRPEGGAVQIAISAADENVQIRVTNTGQLPPTPSRDGVGLQNTRERLRLLFGDDAALTLRNADATTVEATVLLPITTPEDAESRPVEASFPSRLPSSALEPELR